MALAVNLVIDVSGQPHETIYLGLVSIKTYDVDKIIKKFKKTYP